MSVVIDSTRFCHGFTGNLRRNMEALNFSQPTRRHDGKAGGEGKGEGGGVAAMQELSPALAAAELLKRHRGGSDASVLKLKRFGSVSHQVSDRRFNYFHQLEFFSSRSPNTMLFCVI